MKAYEAPKLTVVNLASKEVIAASLDEWLESQDGSFWKDVPLSTYSMTSIGN